MGGQHGCWKQPPRVSWVQDMPSVIQPAIFSLVSNFKNKIVETQFELVLRQTKFPEDIIKSLSKFVLGDKLILSDVKLQVKANGLFTNIYICGFKRIDQKNIQLFLENYQGTAPYSAIKIQHLICWKDCCSASQGSRSVNRPLNVAETEKLKSTLTIKSKQKGKQIQNKMRLALKL